jgi:RHH-type proline utilization regulon transcriptional repressor/proline dehydrogenase/delta 1-pyrroline-5-carboxylate dehydrogenase
VSYSEEMPDKTIDVLENLTLDWAGKVEFLPESDEELVDAIKHGFVKRLRYLGTDDIPEAIRREANAQQVYIATRPVSVHGCVELLLYVMEQSISFDYHRYGNLGPRASELRADTL